MTGTNAVTVLFIYGTLKRGCTNHSLLVDQKFIGPASTVPGYRLFLVADYPGLVRDKTDHRGVQGELWSVDSAKLTELDAFEGIPEKLYRRESVMLASPHEKLAAQTYLYLRTTRGRRPFVDGNWPLPSRA
jgi:gamma-glutamylaminecyclotransferase